jgi:UDP-N-acetylmuramoyl-L-alanyl-D-glutamate--2,6-diaminopimelate ligase
MKLADLFPGLQMAQALAAPEVVGITADSRRVGPGMVFAALKGEVADGRSFIPDALARGAIAILGEGLDPAPILAAGALPIEAANARLALALASARLYPRQPGMIAAVTGTNGKSSTVDFLRQIWTACGHRAASMGTLGAVGPSGVLDLGHTTPDPVAIHHTLYALAADGVTHLAMEASSHGLVQHRLDAVSITATAFTNLTQDHLDYHPDFDAYRAAKARLFSELAPPGSPAVINADSPERANFEAAAKRGGLSVVSVGWRGHDLRIRELLPRATGQTMELVWRGKDVRVNLPLIGEFQALNALAAAGLALALGDASAQVFAAMERLQPVKGRLEFVGETEDGAPVFVDYAHTPDGLDVLLRASRPHAAGRVVVVFGCGGDRDPYKRQIMGEIAARQGDFVIVTDDNPRSEEPQSIRKAILKGCPDAQEIGDRAKAIQSAVAGLKKGDVLLIAGKGHETGQIIKGVTHPFSDQETARAALQVRGGRIHG